MSEIILKASNVRKEFFSILHKVYSNNTTYVIEKSGIPIAKLIPLTKNGGRKMSLRELAGQWKGTALDDDNLWSEVAKRVSRNVSISL